MQLHWQVVPIPHFWWMVTWGTKEQDQRSPSRLSNVHCYSSWNWRKPLSSLWGEAPGSQILFSLVKDIEKDVSSIVAGWLTRLRFLIALKNWFSFQIALPQLSVPREVRLCTWFVADTFRCSRGTVTWAWTCKNLFFSFHKFTQLPRQFACRQRCSKCLGLFSFRSYVWRSVCVHCEVTTPEWRASSRLSQHVACSDVTNQDTAIRVKAVVQR